MRCRQHARAALCSVAVWLVGTSSMPRALAQSPAASASARAIELFEEGKRLYEAQQYPQACEKLAASDKLEAAVGTSGLYAACEEKLGHLAAAYAAYVETAERARRAGDARSEYASAKAAALQARLPRLLVQLSAGAPQGTRVLRDGVELNASSLGMELPVDPGAHVLEARLPGRPPTRVEVTLAEGERRSVTLEVSDSGSPLAASSPVPAPVAPVAPAAPVQAADAPSGSSSLRAAAWIAGGVGVAGIGAAVLTGVVVLNKKSEMDRLCPGSGDRRLCTADGAAARDDVRPWLTANTVAWAAGAGGLALGTVLFLVSSKRSAAATGAVTASASLGRDGSGLTVRGRW